MQQYGVLIIKNSNQLFNVSSFFFFLSSNIIWAREELCIIFFFSSRVAALFSWKKNFQTSVLLTHTISVLSRFFSTLFFFLQNLVSFCKIRFFFLFPPWRVSAPSVKYTCERTKIYMSSIRTLSSKNSINQY